MPFLANTIGWLALRTVAGFASAVVFVVAVNWMLDHLGEHSPHLPGWGLGGVGIGRIAAPAPPARHRRFNHRFAILFASYTLEGIGYIIAGTFLVAAIEQNSPVANGAWLFVGVAAAPSAALWAWLVGDGRVLLVTALALQASGSPYPRWPEARLRRWSARFCSGEPSSA